MLDITTAFATFPVLETERCMLRAATPEDAADIFRLMSDARVTRYLGDEPMASLDEAHQRVHQFKAVFREQTGFAWVLTHREQGQVIGTCVLWKLIKAHFRAELGYVLAPEWWGKGLMTEATTAVLNFGFTSMGLHSVEARIDPANTQSRRLLDKLGFVQEGYFREDFYDPKEKRFTDTAVFSLLQATWMSRA
jgi:ribosomal-protein-alanine N-acetyltransferase